MAGRNNAKKPKRGGGAFQGGKQPSSAVAAEGGKHPAVALPQGQTTRSRPSWRFGMADREGPWSLSICDGSTLHALMEKLRDFESMTCSELERSGDPLKHYEVDSLPTKQARERLEQLRLDDQTRISRLRLTGKQRLYGFMDEDNTFHVLWWDPEHEVWPSTLRNT